jgi:hypothetical protein
MRFSPLRVRFPYPRALLLFLSIAMVLGAWSFSALWYHRDYPADGLWGLGRPLANLWLMLGLLGGAIVALRHTPPPMWARASLSAGLLLIACMLAVDNVPRIFPHVRLILPPATATELSFWCLMVGYGFILPPTIRFLAHRTQQQHAHTPTDHV